MKFSKQRELILNTILNSSTHLTADNIYNTLKSKNPSLSLGTVYRNLSQLTENGFIKKVSIPNQPDRFDKNTHTHGHLVCEVCNEIFDINYTSIENLYNYLKKDGNIIKSYDIVLNGICKKCSKNI